MNERFKKKCPDILPERTCTARVPRHRKVPCCTRTTRGRRDVCYLVAPCDLARSGGPACHSASPSRSRLCIRRQRTGWQRTRRRFGKVLHRLPTKTWVLFLFLAKSSKKNASLLTMSLPARGIIWGKQSQSCCEFVCEIAARAADPSR